MFRPPSPDPDAPGSTPMAPTMPGRVLPTSYGVEMLRHDRWQPLRTFLRRERCYATLDAATAAAVAFWQRTNRASRPFARYEQD